MHSLARFEKGSVTFGFFNLQIIITYPTNKSGKRCDNLSQQIHKMMSKGESIFGLSVWINEIIFLHYQ